MGKYVDEVVKWKTIKIVAMTKVSTKLWNGEIFSSIFLHASFFPQNFGSTRNAFMSKELSTSINRLA